MKIKIKEKITIQQGFISFVNKRRKNIVTTVAMVISFFDKIKMNGLSNLKKEVWVRFTWYQEQTLYK